MRSSGGTNFGLLLSVVVLTKSRIACFAGPSFHDGNGSTAAVAAGWPAVGAAGVGLLVHPPGMSIKESNNDVKNAARAFISLPPRVAVAANKIRCSYLEPVVEMK